MKNLIDFYFIEGEMAILDSEGKDARVERCFLAEGDTLGIGEDCSSAKRIRFMDIKGQSEFIGKLMNEYVNKEWTWGEDESIEMGIRVNGCKDLEDGTYHVVHKQVLAVEYEG